MNILYVIGNLGSGGAERQLLINAKIASKKFKVSICSFGPDNAYKDYCEQNKLDIIYLLKPKGKLWNFLIIIKLIYLIKKKNIDLVHSFLGVPNLISYIANLFVNVKLITSFRSTVDINSKLWKKNKFIKLENYKPKNNIIYKYNYFSSLSFHGKLWLPLTRLISYQSNYVIFNSNSSMYQHLNTFSLDPKKMKIIPNIIDMQTFSQISIDEKKSLRKMYNIPENSKVFLCISRIVKEKNQIFLVENFIKFTQLINSNEKYYLIICGHADINYKNKLLKITDRSKNIIVMEPTENVSKLYNISDSFIFPSKWHEANPNVLLESFASGLYPIISNTADPLNIVNHDENGMKFDANNGADLMICLKKYLSLNPKQITAAINSNRNFVISKYSEKIISKKLINLYNSSINQT